jgi:hypothetical protein
MERVMKAIVQGVILLSLLSGCGGGASSDGISSDQSTENKVPISNAGPDQNISTNAVVILNGSASTDADGDTLSYQWSLTSMPTGSNASLTNPTNVSPTFTVDIDGAYIVQLVVNDGAVNSSADTVTIVSSTINTAPVAIDVNISNQYDTVLIGDVLTGEYVYQDSNSDIQGESSFQWFRDGNLINGASSRSYTLVENDIPSQISFAVTPIALTGEITGVSVTSVPITTMSSASRQYRAVHSGGNWGGNFDITQTQDYPNEGYFSYLKSMNVNWVGVSVALSIDDSMDSSVERNYGSEFYTTYDDDVLRRIISSLKEHGFNVYLTLAFEIPTAEKAAKPVSRWQLGSPILPEGALPIAVDNWPWNPNHPKHATFVEEFWRTYTDQAVYYAKLAEEEGVDLFSLGTETQLLFRTRSGSHYTNNFNVELQNMVAQVRNSYSGELTYDMSYQSVLYQPNESKYLWKDLNLDVIGISAYFELADTAPSSVLSQAYFEQKWEDIFNKHLKPIHIENREKKIIFTEFGYVDSMTAPLLAANGIVERVFIDNDNNDLDDGEEMQKNIYTALFNVMEKHPRLLSGMFFWDTQMLDEEQWNESYHSIREFSFRQKLSEEVVLEKYTQWKD